MIIMREILTSSITWTAVITAASTLIFNVLFHLLKNQFDWFVDKKKFKREHAYNQLTELYFGIYAIILQFEFAKQFKEKYGEDDDIPNRELISYINIDKQKVFYSRLTKEFIENDAEVPGIRTVQNKHLEIVEKIIMKSNYASPNLLELAVNYRYCENNYLYAKGAESKEVSLKWERSFDEEMNIIIEKIIQCIKEDIEILLKLCGMEFKQEKKENEDAE